MVGIIIVVASFLFVIINIPPSGFIRTQRNRGLIILFYLINPALHVKYYCEEGNKKKFTPRNECWYL